MRRLAIVLVYVSTLLALEGPAPAAGVPAVQTATPWIGVLIAPGSRGVRIKDVLPKTPGERAGLKPGDEVLAIDGIPVKSDGDLIGRVQERGVGQKVTLKILREGKENTISLALEARPDELK